ncbi:hypothetical protein HYPSUDRAFT_138659 [Hypholoma sublateritium FD-334 SS-4]|uniref:Uncharacterized protein n=1 Tax=Hypholoma sublateritium (strain FD-334 SS-4) TaxID=945553 RepID=A0A0D2MGQ8_HYPSF|nr:hypothetical protein HYPSUDRAFT_138659 [Hypholoma sublateritium FD-334 SS-4]
MSANIIRTALGPGKKLDSLDRFAPEYVTVRRAFNDLLVFPHLEVIEVAGVYKTNLLSLVVDGNKRFSELSAIDIQLARNVVTYDASFAALVEALSVQQLVQILQPVAQEYADHARAQSETNLKFFADLAAYIGSVDSRIAALDQALAQLDVQIQAQSAALAGKNIVSTLWEVLKTLYKLASTAEDSDVQIAAILGVTISTVAGDAKSYIDALQQTVSAKATSAVASHQVLSAKFSAIPKVPCTDAEIRLHKLAAAYGCDILHVVPSVNRAEFILTARPPDDAQKILEELADSSGRVRDQFDTLLQQPYLDQYICTSPIDGSASNLYTVMTYYRNEYLKLQLDTLPVVRDLAAYAEVQTTLLPLVVPDAQAQETDIAMSVFLAANLPAVAEYKDKATALSDRSTRIKNDWENVVNLVHKSIAECDQNITTFNNSINDFTDKQKKMTLYACLAAFGAFLAFTAAVFLPGVGMLVALAALGGLAVYEAISAAKITIAINDLRAAVANAENTKRKLQDLLPLVTGIAASLSSISLIWSSIATNLSVLDGFYKFLNRKEGPQVLNALRPKIISKWVEVEAAVIKYLEQVAK